MPEQAEEELPLWQQRLVVSLVLEERRGAFHRLIVTILRARTTLISTGFCAPLNPCAARRVTGSHQHRQHRAGE